MVIVLFECHEIGTVLDVLLAQLDDCDEVILVDDHSSRSVRAVVEKYAEDGLITLMTSRSKGNRPANRNQGAQAARNPILLFMDGDVVLHDGTIAALREAHEKRGELAFIGHIHGSSFDSPALALYLGTDEYTDLLKSSEGRRQLVSNPLIADKRLGHLDALANAGFIWSDYYSTYCTVTRDAFLDIGGFDERCCEWGAEDTDLGYRIHQRGGIGFVRDAHGLHVPHPRNAIANDRTNAANMRMLAAKHHSWEFEALAVFKKTPALFRALERVREEMSRLELAQLDASSPDAAYFDVCSAANPNGSLAFTDGNGSVDKRDGLGMATEFQNGAFAKAFVSDNVFSYPQFLSARILQEACRISCDAFVVCMHDDVRIDWGEAASTSGARPAVRTDFVSANLADYRFEPAGELTWVRRLY